MATRPVFVPDTSSNKFVIEAEISFKWFSGYSLTQKQKSIESLHRAALSQGIAHVLEISSKSVDSLGVNLSAFNLKLTHPDGIQISVESAYQGSKVFSNGGPFKDFFSLSGREIKKDKRLYNSGELLAFQFGVERWPLQPLTAFYDWLYLTALVQNPDLSEQLLKFNGFSDIAFNPKKSFSCQARSAALFVSLTRLNQIETAVRSKDDFLKVLRLFEYQVSNQVSEAVQEELFGEYAKPKKPSKKRKRRLTTKSTTLPSS